MITDSLADLALGGFSSFPDSSTTTSNSSPSITIVKRTPANTPPFDPHMLECVLCPLKFPSVALLRAHTLQLHSKYVTEEFLLPESNDNSGENGCSSSGVEGGTFEDVCESPYSPDEQHLLFENRQRSLMFWKHVAGQHLDVTMFENTRVLGKLLACDALQSSMLVSDLETPVGVYPKAVLRGSDIIKLECWPFGRRL